MCALVGVSRFYWIQERFDVSKDFDTSKYLSLSLLRGTTIVGLFGMNLNQANINGMMGEGQIITSLFPTTRIPFPSHDAFDASSVINIPHFGFEDSRMRSYSSLTARANEPLVSFVI